MITCPNCQAQIKEGNKFCIECGTPLTEQATQEKTKQATQEKTKQANAGQITITTPNIAIDLTNVKDRMNNYWQYLVQTAINQSSSFANTNALMGWIQIAVLSLLTAIVLAIFLSEAYITVQFIDFIKVLFIRVIASLSPILVAFLVVRFIKKNPIMFSQATAQMGGLLSLNVFILALVFVFSLLPSIGLIDIILLLIGLTGIINVAAFNVYLYSTDNRSKVDSFIATIIGNVGYLILVMIIFRMFLSTFLEGLSRANFLELLSNFMY